jgi:hypothetical protein
MALEALREMSVDELLQAHKTALRDLGVAEDEVSRRQAVVDSVVEEIRRRMQAELGECDPKQEPDVETALDFYGVQRP